MSCLVLVRHGSTDWTGVRYCGRSDPPLTATGRGEARAAATAVAAIVAPGTTVVTSPLRRARATARTVAAAIGGSLVVDQRLVEVDFGAAEGLTYAELQRRWPSLADALAGGEVDIEWPAGERPAEVHRRIAAAVTDWDRAADLVVVGHGTSLRVTLSVLGVEVDPVRAPSPSALRPGGFFVVEDAGVAAVRR